MVADESQAVTSPCRIWCHVRGKLCMRIQQCNLTRQGGYQALKALFSGIRRPFPYDGTKYLTEERSCLCLAGDRGENWWSFYKSGDLTNGKDVVFLHTYTFSV